MNNTSVLVLIIALPLLTFGYFYGGFFTGAVPATESIEEIRLPTGFSIHEYASVPNARSMALSESGVLFVGTRKKGDVYAVIDSNQDFKADQVITLASGLKLPVGVDLQEEDLYVAEINRILKFENIEDNLNDPSFEIVNDDFPLITHHGWKFIKFGPDGKLYVPVGAPCNVCDAGDPFAAIGRMNADGSGYEIIARGVRNTVGFDWHPETGELWFTDNGRDWFGDDYPPDELNVLKEEGQHFGYPYCHGKTLQDDEFTTRDCEEFTPSQVDLGPHVAALGMEFYTGDMFPKKYQNGIFIAEHGSWNRKDPIGYRVTFVSAEHEYTEFDVFADGWLDGRTAWGRPADVEQMPDGSLLVSDDKAGKIYRISYSDKQ